MPAVDQCEPQVIAALEKEDWRVTHQPLLVRLGKDETIYPDLRLQLEDRQEFAIIVEVKCLNRLTWLEEFYGVVGKYIYYRTLLEKIGDFSPLYVSIPHMVHQDFFSRPVISTVVQYINMKRIVINLEAQEVVEWIS